MSLKTPAKVKIKPEPTLIKKTAETCESGRDIDQATRMDIARR